MTALWPISDIAALPPDLQRGASSPGARPPGGAPLAAAEGARTVAGSHEENELALSLGTRRPCVGREDHLEGRSPEAEAGDRSLESKEGKRRPPAELADVMFRE